MIKCLHFLFITSAAFTVISEARVPKASCLTQTQSAAENLKVPPFENAHQKKLASFYEKELSKYAPIVKAFTKVKTSSGAEYAQAIDELREKIATVTKQHMRVWDRLRYFATFIIATITVGITLPILSLLYLSGVIFNCPLSFFILCTVPAAALIVGLPTLFGLITSRLSQNYNTPTNNFCSSIASNTISKLRFMLNRSGKSPLTYEIESFISQLEEIKHFLKTSRV